MYYTIIILLVQLFVVQNYSMHFFVIQVYKNLLGTVLIHPETVLPELKTPQLFSYYCCCFVISARCGIKIPERTKKMVPKAARGRREL